ncbi:VTE6 [Scenedesmus sp. PABB004]|nr:VTE6 [Scenedesmus sp. PABB004]
MLSAARARPAAPAAAAPAPRVDWRACAAGAPRRRQQQLQRQQRQRDASARAAGLDAQALLAAASAPHPGLAPGAAVTAAVFAAGAPLLLKGLTPSGVAHAFALGTTVYAAFGAGGFALVMLYFVFGTAVTKVKLEQKQREGIAEARSGRRGPSSVWGSGSAGAFCALAALATGDYALWQVGFVASFTSKLSDTVSSEIGKAYGKTTYLITSLRRVPRGTEGAVSAEGTLAGLAAAALFAAAALAVGQASRGEVAVVTGAAFLANVFESYLGAAVQGRLPWLSNDLVNVLQISVAAGLAVAARHWLQLA